jgi:digeranylgeranylglycerophospholipid reductase
MLEKDREIGLPVRCAEGVSAQTIRKYVGEVRPEWIAREVNKAKLVAPDGETVEVVTGGEMGYVLHRKVFDSDLAAMAAEAGAEVKTRAYVYDLLKRDGKVSGVRVTHLGQDYDIDASIVVGADGVESRIGRWAGLKTRTKPEDMDTCVQMTLADIDIDPDAITLYFGKEVSPGGYLWIFPKGPRTANVGMGVSGDYSKAKKPIQYLNDFVAANFPDAKMLTFVAGGVPCVDTLKHIVADGLMLVGDAAHQVHPMSGGGIGNAIIAGQIAGRVAAKAIQKGDVSEKQLMPYVKEWMKGEGKNNERSYKIQQVVDTFGDEDLNRIAHSVNSIPPEKRTLGQIFKVALFRHPRLILDALKVFGAA